MNANVNPPRVDEADLSGALRTLQLKVAEGTELRKQAEKKKKAEGVEKALKSVLRQISEMDVVQRIVNGEELRTTCESEHVVEVAARLQAAGFDIDYWRNTDREDRGSAIIFRYDRRL